MNLNAATVIDAPNLLEVECNLPFYSLSTSSTLLNAKFNFFLGEAEDQTIWSNKLKELFGMISHLMKNVKVVINQCVTSHVCESAFASYYTHTHIWGKHIHDTNLKNIAPICTNI